MRQDCYHAVKQYDHASSTYRYRSDHQINLVWSGYDIDTPPLGRVRCSATCSSLSWLLPPMGASACMPAPRAHRWEDEMESSSRGKRERGTKVVAVKLQSKKVDWRLSKRSYSLYKLYWSVNKRVWEDPVLSVTAGWVEDNGRSCYFTTTGCRTNSFQSVNTAKWGKPLLRVSQTSNVAIVGIYWSVILLLLSINGRTFSQQFL